MLAIDTREVVIFSTRLGYMGVCGQSDAITDLWFGYDSPDALLQHLADKQFACDLTSRGFTAARKLLTDYADGKRVDLSVLNVSLGHKTEFQHAILEATRSIPYGQTISYGQLAQRAGYPRAARAVGSVMSSNRIPLVIPCHRVLGSSGKLHGYSAPGSLERKRQLLDMEVQRFRTSVVS